MTHELTLKEILSNTTKTKVFKNGDTTIIIGFYNKKINTGNSCLTDESQYQDLYTEKMEDIDGLQNDQPFANTLVIKDKLLNILDKQIDTKHFKVSESDENKLNDKESNKKKVEGHENINEHVAKKYKEEKFKHKLNINEKGNENEDKNDIEDKNFKEYKINVPNNNELINNDEIIKINDTKNQTYIENKINIQNSYENNLQSNSNLNTACQDDIIITITQSSLSAENIISNINKSVQEGNELLKLKNDNIMCFDVPSTSSYYVRVIYPASQEKIRKYMPSNNIYVKESYKDYLKIINNALKDEKERSNWIRNILTACSSENEGVKHKNFNVGLKNENNIAKDFNLTKTCKIEKPTFSILYGHNNENSNLTIDDTANDKNNCSFNIEIKKGEDQIIDCKEMFETKNTNLSVTINQLETINNNKVVKIENKIINKANYEKFKIIEDNNKQIEILNKTKDENNIKNSSENNIEEKNILDINHQKESITNKEVIEIKNKTVIERKTTFKETIYYSDDDFVIIPNYKWDMKSTNNLCLLLIFKQDGLHTLRDIKDISLLEKARKVCIQVVKKVFNLEEDNLYIFFHYLPTYFILHLHIVNANFTGSMSSAARAVLLDDVIFNIKLDKDYYKKKEMYYLKRNYL